jgi:zinc transporter ZupT
VAALLAAGWGALAASSLVVGALIALVRPIAPRPLGVVVAASAVAALVGGTLLDAGQGEVRAFILAFAGGAILTMLADTLVPEAFDKAGSLAGPVTTLGFGVAFALSLLD